MNPTERQVLWTTCTSHGLIHVFELAVPALLLPIQAEFHAGDFKMGQVVTLYSLLFGLGALPAGYLADRVGSKVLLVTCLWGASLSLAGMALSPSIVPFAIAAACMGLCLSIYHPAGTTLISHTLKPSGRVFATHGMAGNLGVASASLIAGTLGDLWGWRWALALLAVAGLALGTRALSLAAPVPREIRARSGGGQWTSFVLLLSAVAFTGMVYRGMTTFLPKLFATSYATGAHGSTAFGGLLTTAALLVGLVGMYVAGRLSDGGLRSPGLFLTGALLQVPFLIAVGFAGGPALLMSAMGVGFFHFFTQPPSNHMVTDFTPPQLRGFGYGLFFFVSFGVGSLGAAFCGWISERTDLRSTFPALAGLLIPAIVLALVLTLSTRRSARVRC